MTTPPRCGGSISLLAQGSYLQSGGRYVQGGSQRLSSALARAIMGAGGEVLLRRVVSGIALDGDDARPSPTPPRTAAIPRP